MSNLVPKPDMSKIFKIGISENTYYLQTSIDINSFDQMRTEHILKLLCTD